MKQETILAKKIMFLLIYPLPAYWCVRDMENGGMYYCNKFRIFFTITVLPEEALSGLQVLKLHFSSLSLSWVRKLNRGQQLFVRKILDQNLTSLFL